MTASVLRVAARAARAPGAAWETMVAAYRATVGVWLRAADRSRRPTPWRAERRRAAALGFPSPRSGDGARGAVGPWTVFHPPGTIRIVTPAEEAALRRGAPPAEGHAGIPQTMTNIDEHEHVDD